MKGMKVRISRTDRRRACTSRGLSVPPGMTGVGGGSEQYDEAGNQAQFKQQGRQRHGWAMEGREGSSAPRAARRKIWNA